MAEGRTSWLNCKTYDNEEDLVDLVARIRDRDVDEYRITKELMGTLSKAEKRQLFDSEILEEHATVNFLSDTSQAFPPVTFAEFEALVESPSVVTAINRHCPRALPYFIQLRRLFVQKVKKRYSTARWARAVERDALDGADDRQEKLEKLSLAFTENVCRATDGEETDDEEDDDEDKENEEE